MYSLMAQEPRLCSNVYVALMTYVRGICLLLNYQLFVPPPPPLLPPKSPAILQVFQPLANHLPPLSSIISQVFKVFEIYIALFRVLFR